MPRYTARYTDYRSLADRLNDRNLAVGSCGAVYKGPKFKPKPEPKIVIKPGVWYKCSAYSAMYKDFVVVTKGLPDNTKYYIETYDNSHIGLTLASDGNTYITKRVFINKGGTKAEILAAYYYDEITRFMIRPW